MYGSDPLGLLSWRFLVDEGGHGVTSDLHQPRGRPRAHAARADHAGGRHDRDVHRRAPAPAPRPGPLRPRRARTTRRGAVTNEDYAGMLCEFAGGRARDVRGQPHDRRPREPDAPSTSTAPGRARLEPRAAQRAAALPRRGRAAHRLPDRLGGDRFPYHGALRAGQRATASASRTSSSSRTTSSAARSPRAARSRPGFDDALRRGCSVQAALLRSAQSGRWEDVVSLRED